MGKISKKLWRYFFLVFIFWLIYQVITFVTPLSPTSNSLGLGPIQIRLLQLSISLPLLATWLMGVWGSVNLKRFSNSLEERDSQASFNKTSKGIALLVSASLLSSLIGSLRSLYAGNSVLVMIITIVNNYLYVFPTLISMYLFYSSAKGLAKSVKVSFLSHVDLFAAFFISFALTFIYAWFILSNPVRQFSTSPGALPTYYLPDILIFTTIVLPLFASWTFGILSVLYTSQYRQKVSGVVYQSATSLLAWGKIFIVFTSMFLQLLLSLGSSRLLGQGLAILLGLIYLFILLQATGFLLIGLGSRKLTTIENVLEKYISK